MTRASAADMAAYLQELFGQKLTAAIVGICNPKAIGTRHLPTSSIGLDDTQIRSRLHGGSMYAASDSTILNASFECCTPLSSESGASSKR